MRTQNKLTIMMIDNAMKHLTCEVLEYRYIHATVTQI